MSTVDKTDLKLLCELDRCSRLPAAALSKRLHLPEATVRYRLEKLQQEGILQQCFALVDTNRLGFTNHKILLKLGAVDERRLALCTAAIAKLPHVRWLAAYEGSYNIGIAVKVPNMIALSRFIDELTTVCERLIEQRGISLNVEAEYLARDYLAGLSKRPGRVRHMAVDVEPQPIDATDRHILKLLAGNSRLSAVRIAQALAQEERSVHELSSQAVLQHIKRLEREKIIIGYTSLPDWSRLGFLHYKILLYVKQFSLALEEKLFHFCRSSAHIIYVAKCLGLWDFEIDLEVASVEQYRELLRELINLDSEFVKDYSTLLLTKLIRHTPVGD